MGGSEFPRDRRRAGAEALSARFRSAWTAFAATGDPGRPAYDAARRLVRLLDTEPAVIAYLEEAARRSWERHASTALPLTAAWPERLRSSAFMAGRERAGGPSTPSRGADVRGLGCVSVDAVRAAAEALKLLLCDLLTSLRGEA